MGMLDGKVALITGAARGIGKAIALKFAQEGADVAFTDLVINEAAEETISEIAAYGHKVKGYASNAANFDETHAVVEEILKEFGHIDILVNNAGITKDGLVLRMSEAQWEMGNPGQINYASSKAGLIAMAKTVAKEMGSRGIRANAIAPGFIVSEMTNALPEAVREEYIKSIPLKRGGTVDEIANTALYLASDLSSYVTGQVIAVNGGLYC